MTFAIVIGAAAILFSAGYILRRQGLDTLEFRAGRIRLVQGQTPVVKKSGSNRSREQFVGKSDFAN